jgi:GT2 family glycosyltransferase
VGHAAQAFPDRAGLEHMVGRLAHWFHQTVWTVPEKPWRVDLIVGNCVLVPTEAIKEVGLMDSKRYPNFGDAEYTPRLRRKGCSF